MADREVREDGVEIPEVLERVILWSLEDAKGRMGSGGEIAPFTALVVGETLFTEEHVGDTVDECIESARKTVAHAVGANCYAFCYDGYIELDDGETDAIIAEGGMPGELEAYAFGWTYTINENGIPEYDDEPIFVGTAPNFMALTGEFAQHEEAEDEAADVDGDPEDA